jgi:hypothetical protein
VSQRAAAPPVLTREILTLAAVVVLGAIMTVLDATIVNVALPTLGREFERSTLCVRGIVFLEDASGERVYDNRYVIWGRLTWGLVRDYEVYEDTEKAAALDHYVATREKPTTSAPA